MRVNETLMDKIASRLNKITADVLTHPDPESEAGQALMGELSLLQELSKAWKVYEGVSVVMPDEVKERLDALTNAILKAKSPGCDVIEHLAGKLNVLQTVIKTWGGFDKVEVELNDEAAERAQNRKSEKEWDTDDGTLTTEIKLTEKQREAMMLLDDELHDKLLLLGGSGSGKSFVEAYKIIKDALKYKAPCLVARDKLVDLTQGMIDQIVPTVLQLIAEANGQEKWETWTIDGLKFAKWTDKRSKLEFATGGYIRFAGLSARDLSESGSDKILSPSWLHVMLEEVSELEYETIEKIITRLRHHAEGVLNKLMLCENPPSINHWTYKRFYEKKKEDGTTLTHEEMGQQAYLLMNPKDNVENLGETYIRNLSQLTGANKERFYDGAFQDTETGVILKKVRWTDNLPRPGDWDALIIYCDPTPLTTKEHSVWADYKASVLCGLFDGFTYVLDVRLVRGSTMNMLQGIKQLWDISPNQSVTDIWMEKKQVPSDFKQVWKSFSVMTNWHVPIQMDTRHFGEKKAAIETFLQPLFDNEMILFNAAFKNTERGKQAEHQILRFSRKSNKMVHDDVPDAIMKADTKMKGRKWKRRNTQGLPIVNFVKPAYLHVGG